MWPAGGAQAAGNGQECILLISQHPTCAPNPATAQPPHQPPGEQRSSATVLCQPLLICALILRIMRLWHLVVGSLSVCQSIRPLWQPHTLPMLAALLVTLTQCALCRACLRQLLLP